ncbi:MAG: gliding motility-associated C-terminal domain-containing protein [Bacteroidetes bacterium]|nr:gliding motility-associated C-terminal domain-containing protein [Bacteroidota bacterium]
MRFFAKHNHIERITLIVLFLCTTAFGSMAQTVANFRFDGSKEFMCYTEVAPGVPKNNTRVDFTNTSTCEGDCRFVWDFGDNSEQVIKKDKTSASHVYASDGQFTVRLYAINAATIHDSIKNSQILHVSLENTSETEVSLAVTFQIGTNAQQTRTLQIPASDFGSRQSPRPITIYSPLVRDKNGNPQENFTYFIPNADTETTEPVESFVHVFEVNTDAFRPFDLNMWTYYWEIFQGDNNGNPTRSIYKPIGSIDSLRLHYTFPREDFLPGYVVQLKIALDSSKFYSQNDVDYYNLRECVASQTQVVPVMDYFFDEATRRKENPLDRTARIPNIFTPGGNDENEVFYFDTNGANIFTVKIFNSWGSLVYSETGTAIRWDGRNSSGIECPSGVYYYVIQSNAPDDRHERGGFIHLFRQN